MMDELIRKFQCPSCGCGSEPGWCPWFQISQNACRYYDAYGPNLALPKDLRSPGVAQLLRFWPKGTSPDWQSVIFTGRSIEHNGFLFVECHLQGATQLEIIEEGKLPISLT